MTSTAKPSTRIPVSGPWITDLEVSYVTDAVTNAWYSQANVWHDRFEKAFAAHLGVPFVTSLPSCTSGLHLALASLGIGPGDEVIVPECTWIATAAPVSYVGATPIFADIDPVTWCLSASSVDARLSSRTRAIIPVDLYGGMPDYGALQTLAEEHRIALIEDAAEAIGAEYHGRRAGAFGRAGVFSFHGSKTLTTGEGGLLATSDEELFRRILYLRDHGREPGDRFFRNTAVAFKYKMSALQAALGTAQLERVQALIERKRQIFQWYRERLSHLPEVNLNAEPPGTRNGFWMITAVWDRSLGLDKTTLQLELDAAGIDSRPFFHPLSSLPAYANHPDRQYAASRNPVAYDIASRGLNLPSALNLTENQVDRVCSVLTGLLRRRS
ncbi:MAG: DegT/DnrJ/EryC1/StrS family aminotransferase [Verrucomicrobia bacterium]|nr:DegT/DnrJ/EryC1/StrS family aminotransferase [Verrucomicrobiota bacterium]